VEYSSHEGFVVICGYKASSHFMGRESNLGSFKLQRLY